MSTDRLESLLTFHPFTRLNALLQGVAAGGSGQPLLFSVGEPQMTPPAMLSEILVREAAQWSKYPLAQGTADFRTAAADWLKRRYHLPAGMVDADKQLLPVAGSREGLFMIALSAVPEWAGGKRPAVLIPNPFYHVYAGAAAVAGAEPIFMPTGADTGFLPDIDRLTPSVLERTALAYVCSPANPQGAVGSLDYLQRWIELARRHNFVVAFDECYAEIYDRTAPVGGLEACARLGGDLHNVIVFHSLSKRSGVPGLRSGFVAGDARLIQRNAQLINYGGVAVPYPILAASTALWRDESHVEEGRRRYRANFDMAAEILGDEFGFARPAGGFFLWLDVGDGEASARRLWAEAGIRVLPGAYMGRPDENGVNPGQRYIRVALVYDTETTAGGLRRMQQVLSTPASSARRLGTGQDGRGAGRGAGISDFANQIGRMTLLPAGARDFLRRRLIEAGGGCLIALGVVYWAALMSFHRTDPSLNNATDSRALNLLGRPGAILADLALQSLGLAGFILSVVLIVWGWRVMRLQRQGRWWLRLLLLPFVLLMTAVALAALPRPTSWPLASGLGGATGAMIMEMLGRLTSVSTAVLGAGVGLLAAAALFFALGVPVRTYVHTARRLRALSDRMAGLLLGLYGRLRSTRGGDGATLRAERSHQQRLERQEPQFDRGDDAEDVAIAPPPMTRSPDPRAAGAPLVAKPPKAKTAKKAPQSQATLDLVPDERYDLPPLDLLDKVPGNAAVQKINDNSLQKNARLLESVLEDFGVKGEIVQVRPGPVVTLYELEPAPGTKTSRVVGLADDVARSMSAVSVRIAVVPGRSVIGIELPNRVRETVYLRELLESDAFERTAAKLALVFGKDISGAPVIVDLQRMPHLLIAGTTGSGKSVAINTMILSLIYRLSPDACKFIMIDPKMLELSMYDGIPHLLAPVVTEPRKAIVALKWTVREMEQRYRAMSKLGVRNIEGYNLRIAQARDNGETLTRKVQTGFDPESGGPIYEEEPIPLDPLPLIVVVVDEMADLMLVAGKDIEAAIQRLAQMARAAGIHIIMATQRPSVDVITGTIKANFPTRVSFHVTSRIDSRTILGETGAEQLLGQGDMLYMANGGRITRVHGPLVTDREVEAVVSFLKDQGEPTYIDDVTREEDEPGGDLDSDDGGSGDALYDEAVAIVCRERKASTSFIQRHLQIGYNRAARIIERMEKEGVVSEANRVGKREVLARNIDGNE